MPRNRDIATNTVMETTTDILNDGGELLKGVPFPPKELDGAPIKTGSRFLQRLELL